MDKYEERIRIGSIIRNRRMELKLSSIQLAEKCGVNYSNICKIEKGAYNVGIDVLGRICEALGLRIEIKEIRTPIDRLYGTEL